MDSTELWGVLNAVFDDCMPDGTDEVEYTLLVEKLTSMYSGGQEQSTILKTEISNLLGNFGGPRVSRGNFLKYMLLFYSSHQALNSSSHIDIYEYDGRKPNTSETEKMERDMERSFGSRLNNPESREVERSKHLMNTGLIKDRKICQLEKQNADLKREMLSCSQNEEALASSYRKKIEDLKEQLRDAKEDSSFWSKKADSLDEMENELYKCTQEKKRLETQLDGLETHYKTALDQISLLTEKLKTLTQENDGLRNQLEGEEMLRSKMEELQMEKLELHKELVNISVSRFCPNLVDIMDDDTSPDRLLISYPVHEHGKSLSEELLLQQVSTCPSALSSHDAVAHAMNDCSVGLSMGENSPLCSELVPAQVEIATQTESNSDASSLRRIEINNTDLVLARVDNATQTESNPDVSSSERMEVNNTDLVLARVDNATQTESNPDVSSSERMEINNTETQTEIREEPRLYIPEIQETSVKSLANSCRSFLDSLSIISSIVMYILSICFFVVILSICTLVFYSIVFKSDVAVRHLCNWVGDFIRKSVEFRYREIPPH